MQNKPTITEKQVTIPAGYGYWKLDRYPWGGDFARAKTDLTATLETIVDKYTDGSPRRITAMLGGKLIGVQL